MQAGECFKDKGPHVPADSPPMIPCRCGGGLCKLLTSKTLKNPGRRFYTCPSTEKCGFFKWYDGPDKQILSRPICPCGSGPCRRETVTSGPNAGRSYFVCGIKKNFGACAFFQWEDAHIPSEPEGGNDRSSSAFSGVSGFVAVDDKEFKAETNAISATEKSSSLENGTAENNSLVNGFTLLIPCEEDEVNGVTDGTAHALTFKPGNEYPVSVSEEEEPRLDSRSNSLEMVPSITSSAAVGMNQDVAHHKTEEDVLDSLSLKNSETEEPVEAPRCDQPTHGIHSEFTSKESHGWEVDEAMSVLLSVHESETTSVETNSDHIHIQEAVEHQPGSGTVEHSFANSPSLLDLIEQYHTEKFHFESVSVRGFEAFNAFVGSYKQLKSLHEKAYRLRKLLLQTEKHIACCEAETLEFAASVQEVSGEMNESQKRMQEMAEKLAKEIEGFKQSYFAVPKIEKVSLCYKERH